MKFSLYLSDYEIEKVFSSLRWIFLIISFILFYVPPFAESLAFNKDTFPILFLFGIVYMAIAQLALAKVKDSHGKFNLLTKCGIVFDYIAFFWLMTLTGGMKSPIFPIAYLLVMHATIYWRTKGAVISSSAVTAGYAIFFYSFNEANFTNSVYFYMNLIFVWIIGLFGSMIVLRERAHLREKEVIKGLLNHDYLTGLYNHRCFQENIRHCSESDESYTLILADIDGFKEINDSFGHTIGDEVLQRLGIVFNELLPKYGGKAYRYGGEEFAFILSKNLEDLTGFFKELFHSLNHVYYSQQNEPVTMSLGAVTGEQNESVEMVITNADRLLYTAKGNGKNCAVLENGTVYTNNEIEKKETLCI
ncbi:GGDEF domain-containing protein [Falsibacillus pallidus]|uniref:Diguanylate cyclase (GGDEF)-like protein n=1 Tax=Falsibacillus pallidus TaxID=493781 RepID=A0A370GYK0_9BACI|nr:GGDEF domain-containing protein [Falsibacillus pallidus]RDI47714.1 diguanylate cyclase (GGDEF)-like protein [Falsibacillus pallidus]